MPPTVSRWTGKEAHALREAKRVSQVEFAAELGVSERMIVRWEKGNVTPRPINQQGLDTILAACSPDMQARFAEMIGLTSPAMSAQDPGVSSEQPAGPQSEPDVPVGDEDQVRHPSTGS